jgi:hypothetical protein
MRRAMSVPELSPLVRSRNSLLLGGWTERRLSAAVQRGELQVVRRGSYILAADAEILWAEGRHLAHVIAVVRDSAGGAAVSHESAAVVWGLPLYRHRPRRVHLTTESSGRISSGPDVMRHVAPLPASDVVVRHGIRTTTLSRTVFDLMRTLPMEASVSCADAAERMMALRGREWNEDAVTSWRRSMAERIAGASGARGVKWARRVADFADGRAQLPGESVSRLQIVRLGFRRPRLQAPVAGPRGRMYFVDLALDDVEAFGEFDGKGKYLDEALRRGIPLEQVLLEEKQREDWIRGTTQRRLARWGDEHIVTPRELAARLASFSIRPPL